MLSMPLHWSYHDPYNHHSQQNLQLLFDPSSGMTLTLTSELKSVTILVTPTPYPTKTVDYDRSRLRPRGPAATLHRVSNFLEISCTYLWLTEDHTIF